MLCTDRAIQCLTRHRATCALMGLFMLGVSVQQAHGQSFSVQGFATRCYEGTPVQQTVIDLSQKGVPVALATTDAAGYYQLDWLEAGTYRMEAYSPRHPSYETTVMLSDTVAAGGSEAMTNDFCVGPEVPAAEQRYSAQRAQQDLDRGVVHILTFETLPAEMVETTQAYGVDYVPLGGGEGAIVRADAVAYNEVVYAYLDTRYGFRWHERLDEETQKEEQRARESGERNVAALEDASLYGQEGTHSGSRFPNITVSIGSGGFYPTVKNFSEDYRKDPLYSGNVAARLWQFGDKGGLYGVAQVHRFIATQIGRNLIRWQSTSLNLGVRGVWQDDRFTHTMLWVGGGYVSLDVGRNRIRSVKRQIIEDNEIQTEFERVVTGEPLDGQGGYIEIGQEAHYKPRQLLFAPGIFWTVRYDLVRHDGMQVGGVALGFGLSVSW